MATATNPSPSSTLGGVLVSLGAATTVLGGLGVTFRAAGLGYLGHSIVGLGIGVTLLALGLRVAATARRTAIGSPRPGAPRATQVVWCTAPPSPARVRVHVWQQPLLELGPGAAVLNQPS